MATTNIQVRGNWSDILEPILKDYFLDGLTKYPTKFREIFKSYSSDKAVETFLTTGGLGYFTEKGEGDTYSRDGLAQRYKTQIENVSYGKSVVVTKEMYDDEQYPVMEQHVSELGRLAAATMDQKASVILKSGFSLVGADGVALFSASHPLQNGSTQSNLATGALSTTTLNTAILKLRSMTNEQGVLLGYSADTLIVSPALAKLAEEIVNSPLASNTPNNDKNVYLGNLKIIVWDQLSAAQGGSDTAWYVMDSMANNGLVFIDREPVASSSYIEDATDDMVFKARFRCGVGFIDYKNIVGSTGL